MCNVWKYPTNIGEEIRPEVLDKLPNLNFCNITGGGPFLRENIEEVISVLRKKAKRVVISTNGYFTERVLNIAKKNKDLGIIISIEGLPTANDELRETGLTFEAGNAYDLRAKIFALLKDKDAIVEMGKNARRLVEDNLNPERYYEELRNIYQIARVEKYG